jgi:hypothetical protein
VRFFRRQDEGEVAKERVSFAAALISGRGSAWLEHHVGDVEIGGSNPLALTIRKRGREAEGTRLEIECPQGLAGSNPAASANGGLAERLKASVLKTDVRKHTGVRISHPPQTFSEGWPSGKAPASKVGDGGNAARVRSTHLPLWKTMHDGKVQPVCYTGGPSGSTFDSSVFRYSSSSALKQTSIL